jgi:hypothetical protein
MPQNHHKSILAPPTTHQKRSCTSLHVAHRHSRNQFTHTHIAEINSHTPQQSFIINRQKSVYRHPETTSHPLHKWILAHREPCPIHWEVNITAKLLFTASFASGCSILQVITKNSPSFLYPLLPGNWTRFPVAAMIQKSISTHTLQKWIPAGSEFDSR